MPDRCIASRLIEQCAAEVIACFSTDPYLTSKYSDGRGDWRVKPWPFLPGEAAQVTNGALRIGVAPPKYATGTGGVSDSLYIATFQFAAPQETLKFRFGTKAKTWLDDIGALRRWLYAGGTKPNKIGNIADPDFDPLANPHEFLTIALERFNFGGMQAFSNRSFLVEIDVAWRTREDSQGNRA